MVSKCFMKIEWLSVVGLALKRQTITQNGTIDRIRRKVVDCRIKICHRAKAIVPVLFLLDPSILTGLFLLSWGNEG